MQQMEDSERELRIEPLSPTSWDALARLFNEGGDPRWCWCVYWRLRSKDWSASSPSKNKRMLQGLADREPAPGLVALEGERAVGWVGLGPREDFDRLEHSKVRPRLDDVPVWSVVCFVVSKGARGRGLARRLPGTAASWWASSMWPGTATSTSFSSTPPSPRAGRAKESVGAWSRRRSTPAEATASGSTSTRTKS